MFVVISSQSLPAPSPPHAKPLVVVPIVAVLVFAFSSTGFEPLQIALPKFRIVGECDWLERIPC